MIKPALMLYMNNKLEKKLLVGPQLTCSIHLGNAFSKSNRLSRSRLLLVSGLAVGAFHANSCALCS